MRIDPSAYAAREILEHVITREIADRSATETIRRAQDDAMSLSVLIPDYQHAHQTLTTNLRPMLVDFAITDDTERLALPGWLPAPPTFGTMEPSKWAYLQSSADLIRQRIGEVTQEAIAERPAWTSRLGNEPAHAPERAAWAARVGIIAAYREQQLVTDNDPHKPVGPAVESNHPDYNAYVHAYRAAADLRLAARGKAWSDIDPTVPARSAGSPGDDRPRRARYAGKR